MGVGDLKDHLLSKVLPGPTQADKIRFCSCWSTVVLFFIIALVGMFSGAALGNDILFSQLVINGTSIDGSAGVSYPQITFCPLFMSGTLDDVKCYQIEKKAKGKTDPDSLPLMTGKPFYANKYPEHPDWHCMAFNFDGTAVKSADHEMWCSMNSVNKAVIDKGGPVVEWPGRVRMYVDTPGTTEFLDCQDCVDGIDGAILLANTTSFVFWQAHLIDDTGLDFHNLHTNAHDLLTEYRSVHTSFPKPEVFDKDLPADINVAMGFYSTDVWRYVSPGKIQGPIGGTRFTQFFVSNGGFFFAGYLFHKFVSTFLILLILGRDQLDDKTGGYESAPIL